MAMKILVVDDEPDLRHLVKQRFRQQISEGRYDFYFAGDGIEALRTLDEFAQESVSDGEFSFQTVHNPALPEIVLTDINMPRMDGLTLTEKVKELYPAIMVVVISAYDDHENIRKAMFNAASDFLVKPVDFTELEFTLEKAHRRHLEVLEFHRKLFDSSAKLRRTLSQTLEVIALIGEIRDPYTAGHQRRVAALAKAIAKKMALPQDTVEGVFIAATLHDIGKIYVPAEILSKPGLLSPIEYNLVQEHTRLGNEILKPIDFPWDIAQIVAQHHEHLDGTGYPNGLKGDEILIEARILIVADIVEAVSSHRPYRIAKGNSTALDCVLEGKGTKYDTRVVDACVSLFETDSFVFPD